MARSLYIYSPLDPRILGELVAAHVESFEDELDEIFSEAELETLAPKLDELASFVPGPIPGEISFDDFDTDLEDSTKRELFGRCRSSLTLENLPYLESHPYQVSSLRRLLQRFPEALVDDEGLGTLYEKNEYLSRIAGLKGLSVIEAVSLPRHTPEQGKSFVPVDPIDFLVRDTYQEMERILKGRLLESALIKLKDERQILKDLFFLIRESRPSPEELFRRSGLGAKDFDDDLEKLKLFLRKVK